jgi:hypothetical protein
MNQEAVINNDDNHYCNFVAVNGKICCRDSLVGYSHRYAIFLLFLS